MSLAAVAPLASVPPATAARIAAATDRIAPTWPLDELIAVNPYWGWRAEPVERAAAALGVLGGTALTMPRSWFRSEWEQGRLAEHHLDRLAAAAGDPALAQRARAVLHTPVEVAQPPVPRMALVTDLRDADGGPRAGQTWADLVVHQIGQHCAAHFDRRPDSWHPRPDGDLFRTWRRQRTASHGVCWQHGSRWVVERLAELPDEADAAIAMMLDDLAVPADGHEPYLTALLLSVNGWAAWAAYLRWQARLAGGDDDEITAVAAVRLAWDWLLYLDGDLAGSERSTEWAWAWADADRLVAAVAEQQRVDWLLQQAVERTYQDSLVGGLAAAELPAAAPGAGTPAPSVQAVFCIDVRSEVYRRALESVAPAVQTRGFAGFFGLPVSYTPAGSTLTRPQLPGLLAPSLTVTERAGERDHGSGVDRGRELGGRGRWNHFRTAPSSMFTFVESVGLLYGAKLVKHSLPHTEAPAAWEHEGVPTRLAAHLRPRLDLLDEDPVAAADLAYRVLRNMGMVEAFAPLVLLCGHGARSANNPQAAGLDCGACGGQAGEVNARVLADLLNAAEVRAHLAVLGITIPVSTWFVAGLHTTTTDEVRLFDVDLVPPSHHAALAELRTWLDAAGHRARVERAPSLGLAHLAGRPAALERAVQERSNDWSQVRPEWGLAGNAAFVVAPRHRTRHLDLSGRSFLHDYDWRLDPDRSVLTLIMTAPMVVTNWINLQYHASTVDNRRYGSGNKVLHNVVGGRLGVFEGNGGDLRTGLSMQSLHDGVTLRHPPLRLSVFVEAPREAIEEIVGSQAVVHDLVTNGWLHLLRIDPSGAVERWANGCWSPA